MGKYGLAKLGEVWQSVMTDFGGKYSEAVLQRNTAISRSHSGPGDTETWLRKRGNRQR